jgi:hypothetical protein
MSEASGFGVVAQPHDWIAKDYLNGETADPLRINPAEPLEPSPSENPGINP